MCSLYLISLPLLLLLSNVQPFQSVVNRFSVEPITMCWLKIESEIIKCRFRFHDFSQVYKSFANQEIPFESMVQEEDKYVKLSNWSHSWQPTQRSHLIFFCNYTRFAPSDGLDETAVGWACAPARLPHQVNYRATSKTNEMRNDFRVQTKCMHLEYHKLYYFSEWYFEGFARAFGETNVRRH